MPVPQAYLNRRRSEGDITQPAVGSFPITPDDDTEFEPTRAVWVGGAGNLDVRFIDGSEDTIPNIQAGTQVPVSIVLVKESSTATLIHGWK